MPGAGLAVPVVSISEAQAYVRIETGEEEALVAGLIRSASAVCEAFLNQVIIARAFSEDVTASAAWARLAFTPVMAIDGLEIAGPDGATIPLSPADYAVDIDSAGDGWVRVTGGSCGRVRVTGTAGMAASANDVPEPIRQGVLRLVAHLFNVRDGGGGEPPAAVTALWRPYRRMRIA